MMAEPFSNDLVPLSEREFARFQELIRHETGINLTREKKALLVSRLGGRVRELGMGSFLEYLELVEEKGDKSERIQLIDRICTNETQFFREAWQFEFLETIACPEWESAARAGLRKRKVAVWSAGCSSGEEPFSVGMSLLSKLPGWEVQIVGSDLSTTVLERAGGGMWSVERAKEIPRRYLKQYMLRGVRARQGMMRANLQLRAIMRFARLNLIDPDYMGFGKYDLLLCRNVLIYFEAQMRQRVVERLLQHVAPGGYLFLGHAEPLSRLPSHMRNVAPSVYRVGRSA